MQSRERLPTRASTSRVEKWAARESRSGGKRGSGQTPLTVSRRTGTVHGPQEEGVSPESSVWGQRLQAPWLQAGSSFSKPHLGMSGGGYPRGQCSRRPDTAASSLEVPL